MTTPPPLPRSQTFYEVATRLNQMVPELAKGMTKGKKVYAKTRRLARGLTNVQDRFKFLSKEFSQAKQAQRELAKLSKEANKVAREAGVSATKATKNIDTLTKGAGGVTKAGGALAKLAPWAGALAIIASTAVSIGISIAVNEIQGWRNDQGERGLAGLSADLSKTLGLLTQQKLRLDNVQKDIKAAKLEDQRTRDRVYGVEKQIVPVRENANNALYEARKGREKLEARISDFNTSINNKIKSFETNYQKVRADLDKLISGANDNLQKQVKETLAKIQQAQANTDAKVKQTNDSVTAQSRLIADIQATIKAIKPPTPTDLNQTINTVTEKVKSFFNPQLLEIPTIKASATRAEANATEAKNTSAALKIDLSNLRITTDARINALASQDGVLTGSISNLATQVNQVSNDAKRNNSVVADFSSLQASLDKQFNQFIANNAKDLNIRDLKTNAEFDKKLADSINDMNLTSQQRFDKFVADNNRNLNIRDLSQSQTNADLDRKIAALTTNNAQLKTDINTLDTKIRKADEVNAEGNRKLDQMLPILAALPLAVAGIPSLVAKQVPNSAQITQATGTAICNSANGGCLGNALNQNANNINQNTNNKLGNVLDAVNTGANAAQLAMLDTINTKLGDQVTGGISGFMNRIVKNQWVDRAVNLITMTAAVHNVFMLSDQAATTFFSILDNILAVPALIIDPNAETIDTKQAFGGFVDGFFKNLFGVAEWTEMKKKWAAANRISQAVANSVNEVRSIGSNIIDAVEQTARLTGKGFNAMQDEGLLSEDNWDYSPENLKLKGGLFAKLGKLSDGINVVGEGLQAIESVTSEVRSAVDSANQIKENAKEVDDGVKELTGQSKTKRDEEVTALEGGVPNFTTEDFL